MPMSRILIALTCLLWWLPTLAVERPLPPPPDIAAKGYVLEDFHSGRVLAAHNADARLEPASLTKIMTAYVVFKELAEGNVHLDDEVLISKKAWRTPGSRTFVEVGKRVPVEALIKGMIVQSGNDASVALAEHIAGTEATFAELMNNYARELGMTHSHFVNATGLPHAGHYTTARDIARLTRALIREFPEYYKWYSLRDFRHGGITQKNRNKLLWMDPSVDGVKTGHTQSAGYCLVASAQRASMRLISVVLGTASADARAQASQALLNYGFRFFETHRLYRAGQALARVRVWRGARKEVAVGPVADVWVTIPRKQYKRLAPRMELDDHLSAPVAQGRRLGRLKISLGDQVLTEAPLAALEAVPEGGLWDRARDAVLQWWE